MGSCLIAERFSGNELSIKLTKDAWTLFFDEIRAVYYTTAKETKFRTISHRLDDPDLNENSKVAVQLMILNHLLAPNTRIILQKSHWKPSVVDAIDDCMICHVTTDLEAKVVQRAAAFKEHQQSLQPFIIVVGESLGEIPSSFVAVDGVIFLVESTLAALHF